MILRWIFRFILNDWLILPFMVGLFFKPNKWVVLFFLTSFLPILILFNVHQKHDYYLISQASFLIAIAAIGFTKICELRFSKPLLSVLLLFFLIRTVRSYATFEPIFFDFKPKLQTASEIKKFTDKEDVIYWEGHDGELEIPLYAERLVHVWRRDDVSFFNPFIFIFDPGFERLHLLPNTDFVWIEGEKKDFYFYRTKESPNFKWEAKKHLGVMNFAMQSSPFKNNMEVDTCTNTGRVFLLPSQKGWLGVYSFKENFWFALPQRKFVNIPSESPWGCRFKLVYFEDSRWG